jgi:hypothetical protein
MSRKSKETLRPGESSPIGSHASASQADGAIKSHSNRPVGLWRLDWPLTLFLVMVTMVAYLPAWNGMPRGVRSGFTWANFSGRWI